jgi:hypothetical protein
VAKPVIQTESPELGTIRELSAKLSVARSENRTLVLLSETFSRGTGCRGQTVSKLIALCIYSVICFIMWRYIAIYSDGVSIF